VPRPLVLTAEPALLDDVLRLAAAAGAEPDVADHTAAAAPLWRAAPFVVLGHDKVPELGTPALPRRPAVAVVAAAMDDHALWRQAIERGAEHVLFLPEAEPWLVDRFAEAACAARRAAVVAVLGARGGAGATAFAIGLALAAARAGHRTVLADLDPYGGGIDLALGAENTAGPRWDSFLDGPPPVAGDALVATLPRCGEVTVLAWPREAGPVVPAALAESMLLSCRRAADLVVLDLPRSFDATSRVALSLAGVAFVVCPAEVRAAAAGRRVAESASLLVDDVRCVVRGPAPVDVTGDQAAEIVGLPLAGWLAEEPDLAASLDRGRPPRRRGPMGVFCDGLVKALLQPETVRA
jgi:secretion/DNA translocation related CpaE-like protein